MSSTRIRPSAIELLDGSADWKDAVAAFTDVVQLQTYGMIPIGDPTHAGPLINPLTSPDALAGTLNDGAVVFGTDPAERGIGAAAAKSLLGKWKKLSITLDPESKVREVRTATYGYAITNVRIVRSRAARRKGERVRSRAIRREGCVVCGRRQVRRLY
jgi:hypothetical protein